MMFGETITLKAESTKVRLRSVVCLLFVALVVQASIYSWPKTVGDIKHYRAWCRALVNEGLASAYWESRTLSKASILIDYPPVYPYILYGICKSYKYVSPESFETNDHRVDFFIKLPPVVSNIIIALLIFSYLTKQTAFKTAFLAMSAYALNPAIIFDTSYWGQTDAINSLFVLLSIYCLSTKRPELAWVSITLGVFMKPLAYPFAPIIALFTLKQFGVRRTLMSASVSILTTFIILLPFIFLGRFSDIIKNLIEQADSMPYISVNAHNIWWIVGAGAPWVFSGIKVFGPLSYKLIGITLFGVFYCISILKFWKSTSEYSLYYLTASIAFGFFILSPHLHENHLFTLFPLLSMIYPNDKRLRWIYGTLSFTFLTNMVLHHEFVRTSDLIGVGSVLGIPYYLGGNISSFRFYLTLINSQINILVFGYWLYFLYFDGAWSFNRNSRNTNIKLKRLSWIRATAAALFIVSTSVHFGRKAGDLEHTTFLLSKFAAGEIRTIRKDSVAVSFFQFNDDRRCVLVGRLPSEMTFQVAVPEKATLSFGIALDPRSWRTSDGEGVLFEVNVQDESVSERVFSKYIEPKHNPVDRKWHDEAVDLSRYGGKTIDLTFTTTSRFTGNGEFDRAGWSNPKIEPNGNQEEKRSLLSIL